MIRIHPLYILRTLIINAIPLVGIHFFSWDFNRVLHLFWGENFIISSTILLILWFEIWSSKEDKISAKIFHSIAQTWYWLKYFGGLLIFTLFGVLYLTVFETTDFTTDEFLQETTEIFTPLLPIFCGFFILYIIPYLHSRFFSTHNLKQTTDLLIKNTTKAFISLQIVYFLFAGVSFLNIQQFISLIFIIKALIEIVSPIIIKNLDSHLNAKKN